MLTNDTAIIIRTDDNGDYSAAYSGKCMRQDTYASDAKKYGEERADSMAVYLPDVTADVRKGDYITFGAVPEDMSEAVKTAHTVRSVTRHDYGSVQLRHIKLGVV